MVSRRFGIAVSLAAVSACSAGAQDAPERIEDQPSVVTADERFHIAREGPFQVSALWRSERSLDRHVREALTIVLAVDAVGPRRAATYEDGPVQEFLLAESPRALFDQSHLAGEPWNKKRFPVLANEWFRRGPAPAVAVTPKVHDRTLFGTGLTPVTKWAIAMVAARRAAGLTSSSDRKIRGDELILLEGIASAWAVAGLGEAGFSRPLDQEPWSSAGLVALRTQLERVPEARRGAELIEIAGSTSMNMLRWHGEVPFLDAGPGLAQLLLATADVPTQATMEDRAAIALDRLAALAPRWIVEGGAVGTHPYGWQAVATRKSDALVLSATPLDGGPFTLRTKLTVFSNDLKSAAQADIVLGDRDGDRFLLACNAKKGLYLFRRAGHGEPYVMLAELPAAKVPVAREVALEVRYDGEVLKIEVGGAQMIPVRISGRTLEGRWGFGAHAGTTAMYRAFEIDR